MSVSKGLVGGDFLQVCCPLGSGRPSIHGSAAHDNTTARAEILLTRAVIGQSCDCHWTELSLHRVVTATGHRVVTHGNIVVTCLAVNYQCSGVKAKPALFRQSLQTQQPQLGNTHKMFSGI